jgi:dinuclear metal center YbgI/SA1388 family protein
MRIKELIAILDMAAPFSLQEEYDNSGLQLGDPEKEIIRALVCLDVTPEIIREAIEKQCNLVISHHPLIFKGIKKITGSGPTDKIILDAIKNDIAILSVHTNLDNAGFGVNHQLARRIGLKNLKVLQPAKGQLRKLVTFCPPDHAEAVRQAIFRAGAGEIGDYDSCSYNVEGTGTFRGAETTNPFAGKAGELHHEAETRIETIFPVYRQQVVLDALFTSHPYEEVAYDVYALENTFERIGFGLVGTLPEPLDEGGFLTLVKKTMGTPVLRHSGFSGHPVSRVALCGGSGSFLLNQAVTAGADAFVTSDLKYHQFFDARDRLLLVDAGHYETEQFTKELLLDIIHKKNINFALLISEVNTNPIGYF